MHPNDWRDFAFREHADEEIESLRGKLVEQSLLSNPDLQIGWVPRALQDVARCLAECLREYSAETMTYWTEWSQITLDGTLILKATWFDDETHSTGVYEIPPDHPDHQFWRWVIDDPERRRGLKRSPDIAVLRLEYENKR